jgi:hypothetical protein
MTLARAVHELPASLSEPLKLAMALAVDKLADKASSLCRWKPSAEYMAGNTYSRQALPIVWDFCEANPFGEVTGDWSEECNWIAEVVEAWPSSLTGQTQVADAAEHPLPDDAATVWFTDPPYYDQIPYADLSDFFFVWLKRMIPSHPLLRGLYETGNPLTPKVREIVWNRAHQYNGRPKDAAFFESAIGRAFSEGRRVLVEEGIGCVVFAHQTTEGWEAMLGGLVRAGWKVTASWPLATEMVHRVRARNTASLGTSVHLIVRPRPEEAPVGDWSELLRELPQRVGEWMARLQGEGIRGADLVFSCIGPALEIFSRYSRVETAEGREVMLGEYLEKIWEVVGRTALQLVLGSANGGAGALEEDARLTALFLWTLQSTNRTNGSGQADVEVETEEVEVDEEEDEEPPTRKPGGFSLVFDVVRRFAQPLGIHLPEWEGRVVETKKGVVRLLGIRERSKFLFGRDGAELVAQRIENAPRGSMQLELIFADATATETPQVPLRADQVGAQRSQRATTSPSDETLSPGHAATTLDRLHAAMLLQAAGQANALRTLVRSEVDRGPDFLRLANALAALYPKGSEEKRLVEAMLLAVPR